MDIFSEPKKIIVSQFTSNTMTEEFLSSYDFARLIEKLDIGYLNESNINDLWMSGILNADVVHSSKLRLEVNGLKLVKEESDIYFYSDQRVLKDDYCFGDGLQKFVYNNDQVKLFFHKFRIFSILYIINIASYNFHSLQFFLNKNGVSKIIDYENSSYKATPNFLSNFKENSLYRNNTIALSIIGKLAQTGATNYELFKKIDPEELEKTRKNLCCISEFLDPNPLLHLLIRHTAESFRTNLKGKIGASMLLFEMAELIRRATEKSYDIELKEEIESGFSFWVKDHKKTFFGKERLYDDASVAKEIFRLLGADYSTKIRCYVEGQTEEGLLNSMLGADLNIEVINLKGKLTPSKKIFDIRNFLKRDIAESVFSLVIVDKDREEVIRTLRTACERDEFFGRIFYSNPDFELENFSTDELKEIICNYVVEHDATEEEIENFNNYIKYVKSGRELEELVKKSFKHLSTFSKGEKWGRYLSKYVNEKPNHSENGQPRVIVKALIFIEEVLTSQISYIRSKQQFTVSPDTGEFISRLSPG